MKAWQLLDSPEKWTKHCHARTRAGMEVESSNTLAACWCAAGAIIKCYGFGSVETKEKISFLHDSLGGNSVGEWNDISDYATVHAKLKELDI